MMPDIRADHPPAAFRTSVFWLLFGAIGLLGLMVHRALATAIQDDAIAAIMILVIVVPLASFCGSSRRGIQGVSPRGCLEKRACLKARRRGALG